MQMFVCLSVCAIMLDRSLKGFLRVSKTYTKLFKRLLKDWSFKRASRELQENFKRDSREFQGSFKGASIELQDGSLFKCRMCLIEN